jgi:2-C-methyl-D-erythritol 4-phosphate cytidylyltransferase
MTGAKVKLIEGSYQNIKITTPEDMDVAELFLNRLQNLNSKK